MQSFSSSKTKIEESGESLTISTDVQHLEKLLNRIFGDELEKACDASNLIEFPLNQELEIVEPAATSDIDIFDFSPAFKESTSESIFQNSVMLKSIIEEDESDSRLQQIIDIQRKELIHLRRQVKDRDFDIRTRDLELAANADQLKFMPELFNKALLAGELKTQLNELNDALEVEQAAHEQSRDLLFKTQARVDRIKETLWFKLGRTLGLNLD